MFKTLHLTYKAQINYYNKKPLYNLNKPQLFLSLPT